MSLDSKQKRGSVIGLALPFRPWLVEPTGALNLAIERQSVIYLASAISAGDAVVEAADVGGGLSTGRRRKLLDIAVARRVKAKRRARRLRRKIREIQAQVEQATAPAAPEREAALAPATPEREAGPAPAPVSAGEPRQQPAAPPSIDVQAAMRMLHDLFNELVALEQQHGLNDDDELIAILLLAA